MFKKGWPRRWIGIWKPFNNNVLAGDVSDLRISYYFISHATENARLFCSMVLLAQTGEYLPEGVQVMSISFDVFSHLEVLILSGAVDAIDQQEFFSVLRAQPNLARDYDEFGTSLLMVAAHFGNKAAIEALCNLGANVNAISDCGETALVNATRMRSSENIDAKVRPETVQLLLEHGADPNLIGNQGYSALHWAVIEGDPATVEILLRHKADVDLCANDREPITAMSILLSGTSGGTVAQREVIAGLLANKAVRRKL